MNKRNATKSILLKGIMRAEHYYAPTRHGLDEEDDNMKLCKGVHNI